MTFTTDVQEDPDLRPSPFAVKSSNSSVIPSIPICVVYNYVSPLFQIEQTSNEDLMYSQKIWISEQS